MDDFDTIQCQQAKKYYELGRGFSCLIGFLFFVQKIQIKFIIVIRSEPGRFRPEIRAVYAIKSLSKDDLRSLWMNWTIYDW